MLRLRTSRLLALAASDICGEGKPLCVASVHCDDNGARARGWPRQLSREVRIPALTRCVELLAQRTGDQNDAGSAAPDFIALHAANEDFVRQLADRSEGRLELVSSSGFEAMAPSPRGRGVSALLRRSDSDWDASVVLGVSPLCADLVRRRERVVDEGMAQLARTRLALIDLDLYPLTNFAAGKQSPPTTEERTSSETGTRETERRSAAGAAAEVVRTAFFVALRGNEVGIAIGNTRLATHDIPGAGYADALYDVLNRDKGDGIGEKTDAAVDEDGQALLQLDSDADDETFGLGGSASTSLASTYTCELDTARYLTLAGAQALSHRHRRNRFHRCLFRRTTDRGTHRHALRVVDFETLRFTVSEQPEGDDLHPAVRPATYVGGDDEAERLIELTWQRPIVARFVVAQPSPDQQQQ